MMVMASKEDPLLSSPCTESEQGLRGKLPSHGLRLPKWARKGHGCGAAAKSPPISNCGASTPPWLVG